MAEGPIGRESIRIEAFSAKVHSASSGLVQRVVEMRIDDDQDAVWLRVQLQACTHSEPVSCHVGYRSCFYRTVEMTTGKIAYAEAEKTFDPKVVYGDSSNPTVL